MKKAIFPGSFDPITLGHEDIIKRGISLFDEIVIAIGVNAEKKYMFSLDERNALLKKLSKMNLR
jgi:pantetheine-phosphate adenylyltransferase